MDNLGKQFRVWNCTGAGVAWVAIRCGVAQNSSQALSYESMDTPIQATK